MLASFQVKAGDKTGRIQAAWFISDQESKHLLIAYGFRITVCNISATLNTDEMAPHLIKHLIWLSCHPLSKSAGLHALATRPTNGMQTYTPLAADERTFPPTLFILK